MTGSILVVDDERAICIAIQRLLAGRGYQVDTAPSGEAAIERLERARYHLVITDLNLKTISGMDVLRDVRERDRETPILILTAYGTIERAVEALKLGANDFFGKPWENDQLLLVVDNAYSAATGGQDVLSSKADNALRSTRHPIEKAVRGIGVTWARTITTAWSAFPPSPWKARASPRSRATC